MAWDGGEPEPTVNYVGRQIPISRACGLVWNCTGIIPGDAFRKLIAAGLGIKQQTYAACARAMLAAIQTRKERRALA